MSNAGLPPLFPPGTFDGTPLEEGYIHQIANPYVSDDMEDGPSDVARAFINAPTFFQCIVPMDWQGYELWLGWLEMTGGASSWHTADVPRGDGVETMKVRIRPGTLKPQLQGGEWMPGFTLETMAYRAWSADKTLAAMLAYGSNETPETVVGKFEDFMADIAAAMRAFTEWQNGG